MGLWLFASCEELWVFGEYISEGMRQEIEEAKRLGIPVKYIKSIEKSRRDENDMGYLGKT